MLIIEQIKKRENFTPTENQLAEYILAHNREVMGMSLDELSENAYVSKSTIIRFCKKLGFKGHKELCIELAREVNSFLLQSDEEISAKDFFNANDNKNSIAERLLAMSYRSMNETFQNLNIENIYDAAKEIYNANRVFIFGLKNYYPVSLDLQLKLIQIKKDASIISGPGTLVDGAAALNSNCVVIIISYEGKGDTLVQACQSLKEKNIPIILLTGPDSGSLETYAKCIIRTQYNEKMPSVGKIGSITCMNLLVNILYLYVFSMNYENNLSNYKEERRMISNEN